MGIEILRAEAVAATILLTPPRGSNAAAGDVRPSLLAAQLGADKHCQSALDWQRWHGEYRRILTLLGWCHSLVQQHTLACQPGQPLVPREQLVIGLRGVGTPVMKDAVIATFDALVAGPQQAPGWAILQRHCWSANRLKIAVAFIDSDASLVTCAADYHVQGRMTQPGFAPALTGVVPGTPIHIHTSIAHLGAGHDCSTVSTLTRRLHSRLDTETASL